MHKFSFILSFLITIVSSLYAQDSTIKWQKTYGGSLDEEAYSIANTLDGNFIVAGYARSSDGDITKFHGAYDFWVIKIKKDSSIIWQKTYGGTGSELATCIIATPDSGYLVAGETDSKDGDIDSTRPDSCNIWVIKLKKDGVIEWQKTYWGSLPNSIVATLDGGYILAGRSILKNINNQDYDFRVIKIKSDGTQQWLKTFGGSYDDEAKTILNAADSGYIVSGYSSSGDGDFPHNRGGDDFVALKLNNSGNIEWQKTYGGSSDDQAYSMVASSDSGYVIAGRTGSSDSDITRPSLGGYDVWVIKINKIGKLLWQASYGGSGSDDAYSIDRISDNEYVFTGISDSKDGQVTDNHGGLDIWVVKLKNDTFIEWEKSYGGSGDDWGNSIVAVPHGGCVFAGYTPSHDGDITRNRSAIVGGANYWVVNLDGKILDGKIETSNGSPLKNSETYLCSYHPKNFSISIIDSTLTDTGGNYSFGVNNDSVYVLVFPIPSVYPDELPTWADSGVNFQNSTAISLNSAITTKNFKTVFGANSGGSSFLGGKVNSCPLCKANAPVVHLRVILADSNGKAQAYTFTDANGAFEFKNITPTKYKILVDHPNIDDSKAPLVDISSKSDNNLSFTLYPTYLALNTVSGIEKEEDKNSINIHPNPFTDHTNISYTLGKSDQVLISIFDMTGRSIATLVNTNEAAGSHSVIFNPSKYSSNPAGIYIVSMKIGDRVSEYRLVNLK